VEQVASYLRLLVAGNPGPMTLEGTNTWIVGDPSRGPVVVVDPGPVDRGHLRAVVEVCQRGIAGIILTHRNPDHSAAAPGLAQLTGCIVRAADPAWCSAAGAVSDGEAIAVPGAGLRVLWTPGHTEDSISLVVQGEDGLRRLVSGDMVLGRGTTVIASPDGDLAACFSPLDCLEAAVADGDIGGILPGHGPRLTEPLRVLRWYRQHRLERLDQVRVAVASGAVSPDEVVAAVYGRIEDSLRPAARQSVVAQLEFLSRSNPQ